MVGQSVALLHPGEMGAAVGTCLARSGRRVLWAADGRSAATRRRAEAAGLTARAGLEAALAEAEIVLSVCPPHGALDLARAVAAVGFHGLYVDANAIAPATARAVAALVERAGAHFVDGGIVGPPPGAGGQTRLYLSGPSSETVARLFAGTPLEAVIIEGGVGAASALKMCYAAWTKGTVALLAGIRALARAEGVEDGLLGEWARSQPDLPAASDGVAGKARKAWRWVAEMEEIAASFEAAGLPGGFHRAAAEIFERLAGFQDGAAPPTLDAVTAALRRR
jgi:3-hydroxyisobutyrate dehydrogenase-like beta-hydroxyacid dehydrogenase